jgi:N-glycosylase/DNA lyase
MAKAYKHVDELFEQFAKRKQAIQTRLEDFAAVKPAEYFYELAYCLLTPQSSAVNAGKAISALKSVDFLSRGFDAAEILFRKEHYIRFHNTKAKRLHEAHANRKEILAVLRSEMSSPVLRQWLVKNVKGLGWKEASHFLRNIGHRNLAILDRHILKNLRKHGVIRSLPKTLTTNRYLNIEKKFKRFALDVDISMDELDLVFWSNETGEILK